MFGLYWVYYYDNGLYRGNGKQNGNYYNGVIQGLGYIVPIMENQMEKSTENDMEALGPLERVYKDKYSYFSNNGESNGKEHG